MTTDLVQFLRERLTEDERIASTAARQVSASPNDGMRWRRDWDTVHTAPSDPPGPRRQVADCGHGGGDLTAHIERHDPVRVLREVEAKRRILGEHETRNGRCRVCAATAHGNWQRFRAPCFTLRLLALPYADHPDYREEWRP